MSFFSLFPRRINYPISFIDVVKDDDGVILKEKTVRYSFQDIFRHSAVERPLLSEDLIFTTTKIRDGERPEQLSFRLYGTHLYYWTFFIINPKLRMGETMSWPLSSKQIDNIFFDRCKFKNTVTNYYDSTDPSSFIINKNFILGETLIGNDTGYKTTLLKTRLDYGQLILSSIVDESTGYDFLFFNEGETLTGETSGETIRCDKCTRFSDSPYKYFDTLEGREIMNSNFIYNTDVQQSIGLSYITFKDNLSIKNENLSVIKVIGKDSIQEFADTYRESLKE